MKKDKDTTVLVVFPSKEHGALLREIAHYSNWDMRFAQSFREARAALHDAGMAVVISECCLPDGRSWKDLLNEIRTLANPPRLIVASPLAEDFLWAEVLNLGGYDLLVLPLDATQVHHVVRSAWISWEREPVTKGHSKTSQLFNKMTVDRQQP